MVQYDISKIEKKLKIVILTLLFFGFTAKNSWSQNKVISAHASLAEKIYLHFNKSNYNSGDDIWFKIYLIDANTNKPDALSKIVYVDLINSSNKIIDSKVIKIEKGYGEGNFELAIKQFHGQYTVRAYTNYMRNFDTTFFFRKSIYINSSSRFDSTIKKDSLVKNTAKNQRSNNNSSLKPDLQFFPEGGYLVNNLMSRVGFKITGINGKGVKISGIIVDEAGKKVTGINTSKFGMGDFSFIPIQGKIYNAEIIYNNYKIYYELPIAKRKGVVMQVVENQDNYIINLQSSLTERKENMEVIGSKNGNIICRATISENTGKTKVNIPKNLLEPGVVQFTVFDSKGISICERLVFVENEGEQQKVIITSSKNKYKKNNLVELEISVENLKNEDLKANMSIAITDVTFDQRDSLGLDIKSHLLLNSELKGEIEHPGYYFYSKDTQRKRNLDILMMCQEWNQFTWNEIANNDEQRIKYPIEQGFSFKGTVKKFSNHNKAAIAQVSIILKGKQQYRIDEVKTDDYGYFEFGDYDITGSTSIIIQAQSPKQKKITSKKSLEYLKTNYFVELDTFSPADVTIRHYLEEGSFKNDINHFSINPSPNEYSDLAFDEIDDRIKLDEVEISAVVDIGLKKYDTYIKNKQLYREPSQRIDFSELNKLTYGNVLKNLDGRIAGLSTKYIAKIGERHIYAYVAYFNRTATTTFKLPLYLLDGMPVDVTTIASIPLIDVLFVDVLIGTKAAIYGSAGANGVIAIYTRDGSSEIKNVKNKKRRGVVSFIHPGYSPVKKFYELGLKTSETNRKKSSDLATIYWKPNVILNKDGKVMISFYSANISTTYRVVLEGIKDDGATLVSEIFIEIE